MSNFNQEAMPLNTAASEMYGNDIHTFMMAECSFAFSLGLDVPLKRQKTEVVGKTNSRIATFKDKSINLSVCNLQGCTAVAVISQKGAWLAHIWEDPAFCGGISRLDREVLQIIREGDAATDPRNGQAWVPKLGSLTGAGQIFSAEFKPHIVFLTPGISNDVARHKWKVEVERIDKQFQEVIPSISTTIATYKIYHLRTDFEHTAKGKLLIQYTPAQKFSPGGVQEAMVRVHAVDNVKKTFESMWNAYPEQKL